MSGNQRKGQFEPDKVGLMLSSIFLDQLDTHRDLEHSKPWVQGTGPGVYIKPLKVACVTNRNGQQKKIFWNLKRLWKVLHTLRDHHSNVVHSGPLVCYNILPRRNISLPRYLPQTVHASGKPAKSVLERTIYFEQRATEFVYQTAKGLTAWKWVLSRGSLHNSSFCGHSAYS